MYEGSTGSNADLLRDDLFCFPDTPWPSGCHDGYPHASSLSAYIWMRLPCIWTRRTKPSALWLNSLLFGVLEILTGTRIPETFLLSGQPDGTFVLKSDKVSLILSHWLFGTDRIESRADIQEWVARADDTLNWALRAIDKQERE